MTMSPAQAKAIALMQAMHEIALADADLPPGLSLLGIGRSAVAPLKAELERRTRRSVWSLQPRLRFDPEDEAYELDRRSRARGIDLRTITPPITLRFNPLLTTLVPDVHLGPALAWVILIDQQAAVLEGPVTADGDPTAWIATSGTFLDAALDLWHVTWRESTPVLAEGTRPPLDARQLDVARGLCLGRPDKAIARQLGISERTVTRDVAAILRVTQARSRSEAVLNMLGRGPHSRT